jgi:hypothetical protein
MSLAGRAGRYGRTGAQKIESGDLPSDFDPPSAELRSTRTAVPGQVVVDRVKYEAAISACKAALKDADEWEYPGEPGASVAMAVLRGLGEPYTRHMRQHGGKPPKVVRWRPRPPRRAALSPDPSTEAP